MLSPTCKLHRRDASTRSSASPASIANLLALSGLLFVVTAGCATSPLGRRQLILQPESEMTHAGSMMFNQLKNQVPVSRSRSLNGYVDCVASSITAALPPETANLPWEVVVFESAEINAFAVPGAKIGVYTGLLDVAENADQLAAVIGHEVVHVLARHLNERVSRGQLTTLGVIAAAEAVAATGVSGRGNAYDLMGMGAAVGVTLPFGRAQEREADLVGLDLMAQAGFDPRASVDLWRNMAAASGGEPPEFLSTHPSSDTRIRDLEQRMPAALGHYHAAQREGYIPMCDLAR